MSWLAQRALSSVRTQGRLVLSAPLSRTLYTSTLAALRPRTRPTRSIMAATQSTQGAQGTQAAPGTPAGQFPSFSTVNFYAGSKLNRLSWLRTSTSFLNATIGSEATRFVLMKNNNPLCHGSGENQGMLATLSWDEVKPHVLANVGASGGVQTEHDAPLVFGPQAYALTNAWDGETDKEFARATDGVGPSRLALVFLGIDETALTQTSLPGQMAEDSDKKLETGSEGATPAGVPYFALSLTYRPPFLNEADEAPMQKLLEQIEAQGDKYDFVDLRASSRAAAWPREDAAIVAQAKSLLDWNERHRFCPGCARPQYSLWAGYKRGCSSSLGHATAGSEFSNAFLSDGNATFESDGRGVCPSTQVLSNFHYPRTDPVIIMAIISRDGERVLLGRQKKWPKGFYSCLAGFCEPGESFEEAVRREVLEESGIQVDQVIYHSSQPWPYPTNLMAGFYGIAKSDDAESIRLDLDNELEDARFYSRNEILDVLQSKKDSHFTRAELEKIDKEHHADKDSTDKNKDTAAIRLPPETAIARVLVEAWAKGHAVLPTHMDNFQKTRM